jgi:hypothetical protein
MVLPGLLGRLHASSNSGSSSSRTTSCIVAYRFLIFINTECAACIHLLLLSPMTVSTVKAGRGYWYV